MWCVIADPTMAANSLCVMHPALAGKTIATTAAPQAPIMRVEMVPDRRREVFLDFDPILPGWPANDSERKS